VGARKRFAAKLSTEKWKLTEDDIVLTMGGSGALFYCVYALCNKGDKILMPHPTFPLMTGLAKALGVDIVWYILIIL
jgi:aminotransferase